MLKAQLTDGSVVRVDPEKFQEFEAQFGHLIQKVPGTLGRGPTEQELESLKALLEPTNSAQGAAQQ